VVPPEEPPEVEPEVLPEEELPPYGGKATSGLRMPRAEPCLSTSFQLVDELPEVPDMVDGSRGDDGSGLFTRGSLEDARD
jgi:hypothetical protein